MSQRKLIIGGNWKMNTGLESGMSLASSIVDSLEDFDSCDVVMYPPYPFLQAVESVIGESTIALGAQNMWHEESGAFTGEISGAMLREVGVTSVLLGHSERRHIFGELDGCIKQKVTTAVALGLQVVLCVGETLEQREAGDTLNIVLAQVRSGLSDILENQIDRKSVV